VRDRSLYCTLPWIVSIPVKNSLNGLRPSCPHQGKQLLTQRDHGLSRPNTPGVYLFVPIITVLYPDGAHPNDLASSIHHITVGHRQVDGRSVSRAT
jgi:hypothetical protein